MKNKFFIFLPAILLFFSSIVWPLNAANTPPVNRQLFAQTNTVTINSTTSELTLLGTGVGSLTLPANTFQIGTTVRIKIYGIHTYTGTPTERLKLKLGATTLVDSTAITMVAAGGSTDFSLIGEFVLTCRTTGVSGTVYGHGWYRWTNAMEMRASGVSTIDTTTTQTINITQQWGTNNIANKVFISNAFVTVENP